MYIIHVHNYTIQAVTDTILFFLFFINRRGIHFMIIDKTLINVGFN